jgi:CRP-like cAMP-binding protein
VIPTAELASVPAFAGFDERALRAVGAMLRVSTSEDGEPILSQGERTGGAFVVLDGAVRVIREVSGQRSVDIRTLEQGTLFGLLSCLDGAPRGATVVARGAVRVAEIPREAVTELLEGKTPIAMRFQVAVCRTLFASVRATNRRVAELAAIPESELATFELEPVLPDASESDLVDLSDSITPLG